MQTITPTSLRLKKDFEKPVVLLDLRKACEYRKANIGGNNVAYDKVLQWCECNNIDTDTLIVVTCMNRTSERVAIAWKSLWEAGYTNTWRLASVFDYMMEYGRSQNIEPYKTEAHV